MTNLNSQYAEVLDGLARRWPDAKVVPALDRERALVDLLGSPQLSYPVIHVAGTNGKSSTVLMIDVLLRAHGLRVGRFTSPDFRLTDRISIDGEPISPELFVETFREIQPYADLVDQQASVPLTRFELLTAMAFAAFSDAPVDVAVIEVGMGGSWDCTNVADGVVAVLTPIGIDHQQYLGDTVAEIAAEKVGILKAGATLVCAAQPKEALEAITARCEELGVPLVLERRSFAAMSRRLAVGGQVVAVRTPAGQYDEIFLPLYGAHQAQNAALALAATESFFGITNHPLDSDVVREAFAEVRVPGRLERVRTDPPIFLDAAHNPHSMAAVAGALVEDLVFRRVIGVVSVFADKDVVGMLEQLEPVVDTIICTRNSSPRAMAADKLAAIAADVFGEDRVAVEPVLSNAIAAAVELADADFDGEPAGIGIVITGSVVTVADARSLLIR